MKIGMVTFYDDNYGTCLQAYGLYKTITSLGNNPSIIRYNRSEKCSTNSGRITKTFEKLLEFGPRKVISYFLSYKFISSNKKAFSVFRNKYLQFEEEQLYRGDELDGLVNKYDKFICGSDMIFSDEFYKDWDYLYLGFAPKEKSVAYAPSFGKNKIKEEYVEKCKRLLEGIEFLSCREKAGVDLIKTMIGMEVPRVLDPTQLLERKDWDELINSEKRIIDEPYTLTYVFGGIGDDTANHTSFQL